MDVNLVLFKKGGSQKVFALPSKVTVIGRRPNCDLYIPLMSVSKRHCQLNHHEGTLRIRDLDSHNGTYLNGKRIAEAEIKAGDRIRIGPLTFVFQIDGQPRDINMPGSGEREPQPKGVPTDEDFDVFDELGELDELDELGELEDLDTLEELGST